MKVRHATYQDIPRIIALCREAHEVSQYASELPVDPVKMQKVLSRMIAPSNANTAVFILVDSGHAVHGILIAIADLYWWNSWKYATDVMTYSRRSGRGHGIKLYRAFIAWARRMPKVIEIVTTVSSDIVPIRFVDALLEHLGFQRNGHTWSMYFYDKIRAAAPRKVS